MKNKVWGVNVIGNQGVNADNDFVIGASDDGKDVVVKINETELSGAEFAELKEIAHGGGGGGTSDYNKLENIPIENKDLNSEDFAAVDGAYYRNIGEDFDYLTPVGESDIVTGLYADSHVTSNNFADKMMAMLENVMPNKDSGKDGGYERHYYIINKSLYVDMEDGAVVDDIYFDTTVVPDIDAFDLQDMGGPSMAEIINADYIDGGYNHSTGIMVISYPAGSQIEGVTIPDNCWAIADPEGFKPVYASNGFAELWSIVGEPSVTVVEGWNCSHLKAIQDPEHINGKFHINNIEQQDVWGSYISATPFVHPAIEVGDELTRIYFNSNIKPDFSAFDWTNVDIGEGMNAIFLVNSDVDHSIYVAHPDQGFQLSEHEFAGENCYILGCRGLLYQEGVTRDDNQSIITGWTWNNVRSPEYIDLDTTLTVNAIKDQDIWGAYIGKVAYNGDHLGEIEVRRSYHDEQYTTEAALSISLGSGNMQFGGYIDPRPFIIFERDNTLADGDPVNIECRLMEYWGDMISKEPLKKIKTGEIYQYVGGFQKLSNEKEVQNAIDDAIAALPTPSDGGTQLYKHSVSAPVPDQPDRPDMTWVFVNNISTEITSASEFINQLSQPFYGGEVSVYQGGENHYMPLVGVRTGTLTLGSDGSTYMAFEDMESELEQLSFSDIVTEL